jgi:hypothetical protein
VGAGQLAEQQHTPLLDLRGDILFGHQVHSVLERADHADIGQPVQRRHPRGRQGPREVHYRLPLGRAESGIDPPDHLLHAPL